MAQTLDSFVFGSRNGGSKHPWDKYLDGQIWKLTSEDLGGSKPQYIASQARSKAKKRGLRVRVALDKATGTVVLQAYKADTTEEPAKRKGSKK